MPVVTSIDDMLQTLRDRTGVDDTPQFIRELNYALDWAWRRLYLVNANINLTFGTTGTLGADSKSLDLGAAIVSAGGILAGIKTFWIKGANDTAFIPAVEKDPNDPEFLGFDQLATAQVIQPVLYCVFNGTQIEFANKLPSGTQWQADWIGDPPNFAMNAQCSTTLPPPIYPAIVTRAVGQVFETIDDARSALSFQDAQSLLATAIRDIKKRQFKDKKTTQAFPRRSGYASFGPPN